MSVSSSGSHGRIRRPAPMAASPARGDALPTVLTALLLLVPSGCQVEPVPEGALARGEAAPGLRGQMAALLAPAAEAWNAGDLDGFLADYERSPETTYIGRDGLLAGYDAIRERYAPAFAAGADRDSLHFREMEVRPLGPRHALVTARYVLRRDGTVTSTGLFTLVVVRVEGRWKIIHDHTSAEAGSREVEIRPVNP